MASDTTFTDHYEDQYYSEPNSDDSEAGPDPRFSENDTDSDNEAPVAPPPMGLRAQKIFKILTFMDGHDVSLAELLDAISWGDEDCTLNGYIRNHRTMLLNSAELPEILQRWWKPPRPRKGKKARPKGARVPMQRFALECTERVLEEELELAANILKSPTGEDIKEAHLTGVSFPKMVSQVKRVAPNLWRLLFRLARSESQQERNPKKNPANIVLVVIAMFSYTRSHHRCRLQKLFAIYFKFRGLSAKGFDTLHALALTMSNKWTGDAVARISAESMATMKKLMDLFPWLMSYDNALVAFRVFSQRIDRKSKTGNSTAATVYIKRSAKLLPSTINKALREMRAIGMANPLDAFGIFEIAEDADKRRYPHIIYLILRALFDSPDFDFATYVGCDHPLLQPPAPVYQLPFGPDHVVLQYLLGTVNIPEASYEDNARLILEWLPQLGRDSPEWQRKLALEQVMAWVGDQLTVDRLRNLYRFRAEDDNSFERLDWMIIPPGWLHIQMAFANSIHKQHLGTSKGRGLSAAFDVLGRKGLQTSHTQGTFFHDVSETLHIIAEAQLREVWLEVSKPHTVTDLHKKAPEELYKLAEHIFSRHASSEALVHLKRRSVTDDIKSQSIMFLRDVIPFILLRSAVRTGDVGIMEDMIPLMLYRFVGGRNSNYAGEMLELLQGLHREWPPEICEFVRENCWVINNSGRRTGFMPVDEAQEMNIKDIKVTYRSEGPNIDWEYLKKLHPAIHVIRAVNAHMETEFKTRVRGSKHTIPKKERDIQELQNWYRASDVHVLKAGRKIRGNADKKSPDVPKDLLAKGSIAVQTGTVLGNWVENRTLERSTTQDWLDGSDSDSE
ncbi:hypothetical protein B0H15DRAFT_952744 [Mycena belliarum]|uniref:DUF6589 domain-containing protein n=1 Tax=Mycena belliarum TaxID=1033014 RepID=A0AAD6XMT1_9AGAR|nr:hypothetical protein B0H15DRAFT_952744 [Mycena belliae]